MPTLPAAMRQPEWLDPGLRRIFEDGERERAQILAEYNRVEEQNRQVDERDLGNPWEFEPSQGEFWGRVYANAGRPEPADVTAARNAEGFRPPRIPDVDLTLPLAERRPPPRPAKPSIATPWATTVQPATRPAEPEAAPRVAAPPWSQSTIEESTLPPATAAPQADQTPATADEYPQTIVRAPMPEGRRAPSRAPARTQAPVSPVDRQIQAQGMARRTLSEQELRDIRQAMADLPPDQAPTFNPLQAYDGGSREIPPEERARESVTDWIFGYHPKNRVTAREIIEDVDRQLAERRTKDAVAQPAETGGTDNPVDRQAAAQGIPRRHLTLNTLIELRAILKTQPPGEAPRKSPLQDYPMFGSFDGPPEERIATRPGTGYDLFGHQPRNHVTNADLIADIDRQIAEIRMRTGLSAEVLKRMIERAEATDRQSREGARRRYPQLAPQR